MAEENKLGIDIGITADTSGATEAKASAEDVKRSVEEIAAAERKAADEREALNMRAEEEGLQSMVKRQKAQKKGLDEMEMDAEESARKMQMLAAKVAAGAAGVAGAGMKLQALANDLREINPAAADAIESIGQVTEKAGTLATTIASGFALGGPYGAIAGTVVGLGKILIDEYETTNREILRMQQENADLAVSIARGQAEAQRQILAETTEDLRSALDRDNKLRRQASDEMERFVRQRREQIKALDEAGDAESKAKLAAIKARGGDNQAEAEIMVDDAIRKFNSQSQVASAEMLRRRNMADQEKAFAYDAKEKVEPARSELNALQSRGAPEKDIETARKKLEKIQAAAEAALQKAEEAAEISDDYHTHEKTLANARLQKLRAEIDQINTEKGTNYQLPLETAAKSAATTIETAAKNVEDTTRGAAAAVQPAGQSVADAGQQLASDLRSMASGIQATAAAIPAETMQASYQKLVGTQSQAYEKITTMFNEMVRNDERLLARLETIDRAVQLLQSKL